MALTLLIAASLVIHFLIIVELVSCPGLFGPSVLPPFWLGMLWQWGTPRRGGGGRGRDAHHSVMAFASDFEARTYTASRKCIEDWEARVVADHLALGKDEGKVNHH